MSSSTLSAKGTTICHALHNETNRHHHQANKQGIHNETDHHHHHHVYDRMSALSTNSAGEDRYPTSPSGSLSSLMYRPSKSDLMRGRPIASDNYGGGEEGTGTG